MLRTPKKIQESRLKCYGHVNEGTSAIVKKYRNLLKKTKGSRVGQIILSGVLPVFVTGSQ